MAAEEFPVPKSDNQAKEFDYSNYKPLELNLGVFWTAKGLGDKTTLSFNYVRDFLKFNFSMTTDDGKKEQLSKKFRIAEGYKIAYALSAILADRIATLNKFIEDGAEGVPNYSELPEEPFTFYSHYFDKSKNEDVKTGKITISTVPVNGVNRICIKGYSETEMLQIRVIFYDEFNDKITKVSKLSYADGGDIDFYRLKNEVEKSLGKTFEYAAADKIYQAIIYKYGNKGNFQNNNGEKKFGFFNKNTQRQIAVNDSNVSGNNESGVDLFDQEEVY
jgi:hypothetical protein